MTVSPAAGTTAATPATADAAQTTLGSNYQTFLKLLMTQLQNQDPTSPLDTNQFTSQLVQYSSVEQQIQTNTNLGTLIQLGQSNSVLQSAAIVGHQVDVAASDLSLQNGAAALNFTAPAAGPVRITVSDASGGVVGSAQVNAAAGQNAWSWDGLGPLGNRNPDGAYGVTVTDASGTALPFTVQGTATGVSQGSGGTMLQVGALSVPFGSVTSVGK